jgi:formylmethanofuran dehydrogenase subunit E
MFTLRTTVLFCTIATLAVACLAHEPSDTLPPPRYQPKPTDPAWLAKAVQLHGHLGPWVVAGARLGMAGARAVDAKNHFDVEVVCAGPFQRPPQSCFLDGMQIGSGATLGKRTIEVVEAKELVVKLRNPRTKKAVEVRPTRKLLDILEPPAQTEEVKHDEGYFEEIARRIAAMPDEDILVVVAAK